MDELLSQIQELNTPNVGAQAPASRYDGGEVCRGEKGADESAGLAQGEGVEKRAIQDRVHQTPGTSDENKNLPKNLPKGPASKAAGHRTPAPGRQHSRTPAPSARPPCKQHLKQQLEIHAPSAPGSPDSEPIRERVRNDKRARADESAGQVRASDGAGEVRAAGAGADYWAKVDAAGPGPRLTCKAWVVVDAGSGCLLRGHMQVW